MKNLTLLRTHDDFNPFTEEVQNRCLEHGKCLVKLRDGQWREVICAKDPDEEGSATFRTEDWSFWWYNDGSSPTRDGFDMLEIQ